MKKLLVLLMAVVMLASSIPGVAEMTDGQADTLLRYSYTTNIVARLSISSSGTATCSGEIDAKSGGYDTEITVKLLQKKNGVWSSIASWSGTTYKKGTKTVPMGYSYKVVVSGKVKNAAGAVVERPKAESAVKSY